MPRVDRIVNRASLKAKLKQLQRAVKQLERHSAQEYKRGFEMGGLTMKKAIEQAQAGQAVTKLDGE